jgi:prepilin-type N-terminal cleavage/methylation domain-containing protein
MLLPRHADRRAGGFTLLELVVVLALLAVITAAVVPIYGGSVPRAQLRTARSEIASRLMAAQEAAVRESRIYRFYISPGKGEIWVMQEQPLGTATQPRKRGRRSEALQDISFVQAPARWAKPWPFPEYLELSRAKAREDKALDAYYVECHPNGACDRAQFVFGDKRRSTRSFVIRTLGTVGRLSDKTGET